MLPFGFKYLDDERIIYSLDYCSSENFVGRPIKGYESLACVLTLEACQALIAVQNTLDTLKKGYHLKIFDAYRPQRAVEDFKKWSLDHSKKEKETLYFPRVLKKSLFSAGYVAEKSSHSRGSTVDLTIVERLENGDYQELEMGTRFDFFDELSHTLNPNISEGAKKNRAFLVDVMAKQGFVNYPLEWWHFTLENEPFPDTYFDFPIQ